MTTFLVLYFTCPRRSRNDQFVPLKLSPLVPHSPTSLPSGAHENVNIFSSKDGFIEKVDIRAKRFKDEWLFLLASASLRHGAAAAWSDPALGRTAQAAAEGRGPGARREAGTAQGRETCGQLADGPCQECSSSREAGIRRSQRGLGAWTLGSGPGS